MRIRHYCSLVLFWLIFDFRRSERQINSSVSEVVMAELREEMKLRLHKKHKWKFRPQYFNRQLTHRSAQSVAHRYLDQRKIRRRCINL